MIHSCGTNGFGPKVSVLLFNFFFVDNFNFLYIGDTIWFNIVENKSHLWGVQPFYWYFINVLPNIFFTTILLLPFACFWWSRFGHPYTFVSILFIFLYSFLPHKELRFIIYAVPLLNTTFAYIIVTMMDLIAQFQRYVFELMMKSTKQTTMKTIILTNSISIYFIKRLKQFFLYGLIVNLLLNLTLTIIKLYISSYNYPGGYAIQIVNDDIRKNNWQSKSETSRIGVYVCDLAAQSGMTRFLQLENVYYNKEPKFNVEDFLQHDWIYFVIEPKDRHEYFDQCTDDESVNCQIVHRQLHSPTLMDIQFNCTLQQSVLTLDKSSLTKFQIAIEIHKCQYISITANESIEFDHNHHPSY